MIWQCCLCVCVSFRYQLLNAWTNLYETWYTRIYHGTWAPLSGALLKSLPSVCVSVCMSFLSLLGKGPVNCIPPFVDRQRLDKNVPAATNTRNSRRIVGCVIFYIVRVFCESVCVSPCICWVTTRYICSHGNEELLQTSYSIRFILYQEKVRN
jgi:hypothetical protein